MTKRNTNRGKSTQQRDNELQQNQDHGANNQRSTMPEGNDNNKQNEDDDKRKQKHSESKNTEPTQE
jgi:hypothetical protein